MDKPRTVSVTLLRSLQTYDWGEEGPFPTPVVLAAGTKLAIPFHPGITILSEDPYGAADNDAILFAAAEVPCDQLDHESCGCDYPGCGHGDWFCCGRFGCGSDMAVVCLGDKAKCPNEGVRAEAKAAFEEEARANE